MQYSFYCIVDIVPVPPLMSRVGAMPGDNHHLLIATPHPNYRTYRDYGYRLAEIADHLRGHAATVSRRLKQAEQAHV